VYAYRSFSPAPYSVRKNPEIPPPPQNWNEYRRPWRRRRTHQDLRARKARAARARHRAPGRLRVRQPKDREIEGDWIFRGAARRAFRKRGLLVGGQLNFAPLIGNSQASQGGSPRGHRPPPAKWILAISGHWLDHQTTAQSHRISEDSDARAVRRRRSAWRSVTA